MGWTWTPGPEGGGAATLESVRVQTEAQSQLRVCILENVHPPYTPTSTLPVMKWDSLSFAEFPGCITVVLLTSLDDIISKSPPVKMLL